MKLSKKLSEAILQALGDLDLCMNDPKYTINFEYAYCSYKSVYNGGQFSDKVKEVKCIVCFAGAVMAKTLNAATDGGNFLPSDFRKDELMLNALDCVRQGSIQLALKQIEVTDTKGLPEKIEVNQKDYKQFKKDMNNISKILMDVGL